LKTKVKDNEHTIFANTVQSILSISTTVE